MFLKHKLLIQIILLVFINSLISASRWHIENGWVYRDNKKFFAIGIWGIPKYEPVLLATDKDSLNINLFKNASSYFNLIFVQFAREQYYMKQQLLACGFGHFMWKFKNGYDGLPQYRPDKDENGIIDLKEMKFIKNNLYPYYYNYLSKSVIDEIEQRFKEFDLIWLLSDEPNTGFNDWFWYPSIIQLYNQIVKEKMDSSLTYLDLFGNLRGDKYSYEMNFIKKFNESLDSLKTGTNRDLLEGDPSRMQSYIYSANGIPVYKLNKDSSTWIYNDLNLFDNTIYYNIYQAADIYGMTCDVLGLNAYFDFYRNPALAGLAVDAMKDACGNYKPIWLFFDGAGYIKPKSMSDEEYLTNIKCQIYCSIVHGATGVLFWSKKETSQNYWTGIKRIASELNENLKILESIEISRGVKENIHYSIRKNDNEQKIYIIAVNTDKFKTNEATIFNININLKPFEEIIVTL